MVAMKKRGSNEGSSGGGGCPYANFVSAGSGSDSNKTKTSLAAGTFTAGSDENDSEITNVKVVNTNGTPTHLENVRKALEIAKTQCPAFNTTATAGGACPFRNAHSSEQFQDTMKLVPASHFAGIGAVGGSVTSHSSEDNDDDQNSFLSNSDHIATPFRLALEHVHAVSQVLHNKSGVPALDDAESVAPGTPVSRQVAPEYLLDGGCPFKQLYHDRSRSQNDATKEVFVPFVHAMEEYSISAQMIRMLKDEHLPPSKRSASAANLSGMSRVDSMDALASFFEKSSESKASDAAAAVTKVTETPTAPEPETKVVHIEEDDHEKSFSAVQGKLSSALKTGTTQSHKAAENVHFVRNFIKGKIDMELFVQLTEDMYHVYVTLEGRLNEFAEKQNVVWKPLHRPHQLARTEALKRDLIYFLGKNVDFEALTPTTATQDYMDRLNHVAETDPLLLLSHAYTRYLGDLSGGRVLQRVAQKALQLPKAKDGEPSGLQFYEFPNIPEGAKTFKDWYRQTLDGLTLSELDIAKLVGEANVAFLMNMRVFEELDVKAGVEGAQVRPLAEALKYYDDAVQAFEEEGLDKATNANAPRAECPFLSKKAATSNKTAAAGDAKKCPMNNNGTATPALKKNSAHDPSKRCPWPFVFFHDPAQGMRDYQTWVVLCLISCFLYKVVFLPFLVQQ